MFFRERSSDGKTLWWKVPNRDIRCASLLDWISEVFRIFIVDKLQMRFQPKRK